MKIERKKNIRFVGVSESQFLVSNFYM